MSGARWLLAILLTLVVVGLIAYARGDEHHRGDDVGALRPGLAVVALQPREVSSV